MNSGNEYLDILSYDTPHSNFTFMAEQFGCGDLESSEELACMRTVDADDIAEFLHVYVDAGTTPKVSFAPVVDEKTVFTDFYDRAINGHIAVLVSDTSSPRAFLLANNCSQPTIMGSCRQDGVPFVPYSPEGVNATLADEVTQQYFFCPAYKSAK